MLALLRIKSKNIRIASAFASLIIIIVRRINSSTIPVRVNELHIAFPRFPLKISLELIVVENIAVLSNYIIFWFKYT